MPAQDMTGPRGEGSFTGRGFGLCGRRAFGRGFGLRRMWLPQFQPVELTKEEERKILEAELKEIEQEKKELEEALKKTK